MGEGHHPGPQEEDSSPSHPVGLVAEARVLGLSNEKVRTLLDQAVGQLQTCRPRQPSLPYDNLRVVVVLYLGI